MNYLNEILINNQNTSIIEYVIVFVLVFFESFAFIGLVVPGTTLMIFVGFLAAHGIFNPWILFVIASVGAILGDCLSFSLGRRDIIVFHDKNRIFKTSFLEKGKKYFIKHGGKSVFFGRFIGWIRPIVPFVAGVFNLDKKTFFLWNVLSGILWAASHIAIGYFFGYMWKAIVKWSDLAGIIIVVIFIIILCVRYARKMYVANK